MFTETCYLISCQVPYYNITPDFLPSLIAFFSPCRSSMEVLSGPWADLALLLRQTIAQTDKETDGFLPLWLFGLLLFLSVCLLLLQLIIYLSWKLRQGKAFY